MERPRSRGLQKRQGTPGFEPGTIRTAAECSTTELRTHNLSAAAKSLLPGFEPGLPDSRSGVLTTTLQELMLLYCAGAFSSVVERPFCIRKVEGSNPSSSTFAGNRGLTVRILALQASGPGSTPGGCSAFQIGFGIHSEVGAVGSAWVS